MSRVRNEILKILGVGAIGVALLGTSSYAVSGTVTASSVRIREDASSSSNVISVATEGEKVDVIGEKDGWYNVNFEDVTGYIKAEYVKTDFVGSDEEEKDETTVVSENTTSDNTSTSNNATSEPAQNEGSNETENTVDYTKNSRLKLEQEVTLKNLPSFASKNTSSIASGTDVTICDELNHWVKITDGNVSGWALKVDVAGDDLVVASETVENPENNSSTEVTNEPENNSGSSTESGSIENSSSTSDSTTGTESSDTNNPTSTASKKGYINTDGARVRASKNGTVLDVLDENTEVEIVGEDDDWYIVKYDGANCYVSQKLVTIK